MTRGRGWLLLACTTLVAGSLCAAREGPPEDVLPAIASLRAAVEDLTATFGDRYPGGGGYLARLDAIELRAKAPGPGTPTDMITDLEALRREALVANPLVSGRPLLFVVRPQYRPDHHSTATLFQTGEINTQSFQGGGALKAVHLGTGGKVKTLLSVPGGIVRDPEVSFDGQRILFSMRRGPTDDYHIYEIGTDGTGLRQLTSGSGISDIDPVYLPAGEIVFSSTREPKYCHCNRHIMANLFKMSADGEDIHQIGHSILFEGHPALLPDGRILYDRWEYVDRHFGPSFGLWTVNPDGTQHALYYGNNAWSPGAILDARSVPGTERFIATFGSCHDRPWGAIAIVDRQLGLDGDRPVVKIWPAGARQLLRTRLEGAENNAPGHPLGGQIDNFTRIAPKYEDPCPLSEKHFLASRAVQGEEMAIFLLDLFGNEVLLHREPPGCYDAMPIAPRRRPPVIPSRTDLARDEGLFYVIDVYRGTGMEQVRRGSIRTLRIVEAPQKLFWTREAWSIDAAQAPAMNWNATNSKRILGDVPVEDDGSAYFAVPSDRFIYFQALDENKMMVQSMRSGTQIMPGETQGCVGCHEDRLEALPPKALPIALRRPPSAIEPWYGPPRDFNYLTEVQPVFDRHCVSCHDHGKPAGEKLNLSGDLGLVFNTSYVELRRRSPLRWFPDPPGSEKPLVKVVDDGPPEVLPPFSWGAHRSRLADVFLREHKKGKVGREDLERIVTWIDMNAPYYGSYASAYPGNAFGRSPLNPQQLQRLRELTGVEVGTVASERRGSQVNLTRAELSPVLSGLREKGGPAYAEALDIIRAGQRALAELSRPDIPGSPLPEVERTRQEKYDRLRQVEKRARERILRAPGRAGDPTKGRRPQAARPETAGPPR